MGAPSRGTNRPAALRTVLGWVLVVAVWEWVARTVLAGRHLIGVPSGIVVKLVENSEVYGRGLWFTTREAVFGYLLGNLAAVMLALLVVLLPGLLAVMGLEIVVSWRNALAAANAAFDRSLLGAIKAMDANISTASGGLSVELPYRMLEFFELTASGQVF